MNKVALLVTYNSKFNFGVMRLKTQSTEHRGQFDELLPANSDYASIQIQSQTTHIQTERSEGPIAIRNIFLAPNQLRHEIMKAALYRGQFQLSNTYTFLCTLSSSSELAQGTKNQKKLLDVMNQDGDRYCNEHGLVKI